MQSILKRRNDGAIMGFATAKQIKRNPFRQADVAERFVLAYQQKVIYALAEVVEENVLQCRSDRHADIYKSADVAELVYAHD